MIKPAIVAVILFALVTGESRSGDWSQILGPHRNGIAVGEKLGEWPEAGPETLWSTQVGEGFAGVAVAGSRLLLFHRKGDQEITEARDSGSGEPLWSSASPTQFQSGYSSDNGPRCVPLISGNRVFVFGAEGTLRCLDLKTGASVWQRDTWKDFSAPSGYFGAGSTPVLYKNLLIVNVGGRTDAAVVAFSTDDGSTVWKSFDDAASYSSPVVTTADETDHVIVVTRLNTVSLNPLDGAVRFQFPFGARGPTVNGATPVVLNNCIFLSASYRVGSVWAPFTKSDCQPEAHGETLLATQYATPIAVDNLLYAVDGRQDAGPGSASIKCIDPRKQKILWEESGFDYGTLILVEDELLFLSCGGEIVTFKADPARFRETRRCTVLGDTPRGYRLPALSSGRLYVRDNEQLKCLQVGVQ